MKALAQVPANANAAERREPATSTAFLERQAFEAFRTFVAAFRILMETDPCAPCTISAPVDEPTSDVMTADEVAVFLGVDRNTVYDFAGRGVIPHQRLGTRLLFRRGAVVSWLDSSLCAITSTRKR